MTAVFRRAARPSCYDSLAMKSIIVGTAGHIDHGKTALVKALTGIDADRLEEEKRRGEGPVSSPPPFLASAIVLNFPALRALTTRLLVGKLAVP